MNTSGFANLSEIGSCTNYCTRQKLHVRTLLLENITRRVTILPKLISVEIWPALCSRTSLKQDIDDLGIAGARRRDRVDWRPPILILRS